MIDARGPIKNDDGDVLIDDNLRVNNMIDARSAIKNNGGANDGDVLIDDDVVIKNKLDVNGKIENESADNNGDVFIDDNVRIDDNLRVNKMIDARGAIKNNGGANNGDVFINDDVVITNKLDIHNIIENETNSFGGAVRINDDVRIDGMLDLRGVLKDANDGEVEIAENNDLKLDGSDSDIILDGGADIELLGESGNLFIEGEIYAPDDDELDIEADVMISGELNVTDGIRNSDGWVAVTDGMGLRVNQMLNVRGAIKNLGPNNLGRVVIQDPEGLTLDGGGLAATNGPVIIDDSQGLRVQQSLGVNGNARINGSIFSTSGDVDITDDLMVTGDVEINGDIFNGDGEVEINDDVEIAGDLSVNGMITNSDGPGSMLDLTDPSGVVIDSGNDIMITADDDITITADANNAGSSGIINLVADEVQFNGSMVTFASDERFKDKIRPIEGAIESLAKLSGYTYFWNGLKKGWNSEEKQYGVIAQEVETLFPDLVTTNKEGYKAVNYIGLIPVLIEGAKEQQKEIDELKAELQEIKSLLLKQMEDNK